MGQLARPAACVLTDQYVVLGVGPAMLLERSAHGSERIGLAREVRQIEQVLAIALDLPA